MADNPAISADIDQVITLERPQPATATSPIFTSAQLVPGRAMMVLQIGAVIPSRGPVNLLQSPPTAEALAILDGDTGEFAGNKSFSMGGAFLLPYANRIRGTQSPDGKSIQTHILGKSVSLPANWGGREAGSERYAMHGLTLASKVHDVRHETTAKWDRVTAMLDAGDFGGHWLSSTQISYDDTLTIDAFTATITARNVGDQPLPIGIGWHPYFALPSGHRAQARIHIPARQRVVVNNYGEVLPTGAVVPVAGTEYDFSAPAGKALGDLYLDDCFVDLIRTVDGDVVCEIIDPEASYGIRIVAMSPHVSAVQVYAPPDKSFVALEPQFNWADPFGSEWAPGVDTGMVVLPPSESVTYSVRLELFTP